MAGFLDLLTSMTLNDREPPPQKREGFGEFFAIFDCSAHFKSELRRNA